MERRSASKVIKDLYVFSESFFPSLEPVTRWGISNFTSFTAISLSIKLEKLYLLAICIVKLKSSYLLNNQSNMHYH
ncbi:MAG: hypothetical protein WAT22_11170 [Saprospiraceae bacterium]|nr:hypothetical protein [Saprospiraceae bacterium]MBP6446719.1 hypothetical protein [Saprospiraceae bacterium]